MANDKKCGEWQTVLVKQHRNRTSGNRLNKSIGSQKRTETTQGESQPYQY